MREGVRVQDIDNDILFLKNKTGPRESIRGHRQFPGAGPYPPSAHGSGCRPCLSSGLTLGLLLRSFSFWMLTLLLVSIGTNVKLRRSGNAFMIWRIRSNLNRSRTSLKNSRFIEPSSRDDLNWGDKKRLRELPKLCSVEIL